MFFCIQYYVFTVYILGELKQPMHCSQAAKCICVQNFFLDGQLTLQTKWQLLCTISHELFKHQWRIRMPGSWKKSNFHWSLFAWCLPSFHHYAVNFFIILFQPPLWLLWTRSHCCIVTVKNYQSGSVRTLEQQGTWLICWLALLWSLSKLSQIKTTDLGVLFKNLLFQ